LLDDSVSLVGQYLLIFLLSKINPKTGLTTQPVGAIVWQLRIFEHTKSHWFL